MSGKIIIKSPRQLKAERAIDLWHKTEGTVYARLKYVAANADYSITGLRYLLIRRGLL